MTTKHKVLVIEDDARLMKYYPRSLERAGYLCDVVDAKDAAIDVLRNKSYDAAIIDLQLRHDPTHKAGIEVLEYIVKCNEGTKSLVVSASQDVRDAVAAYRMGTVDFVMKTDEMADTDDIIPRLKKVLSGYKVRLFGTYESLHEYLAAPEGVVFWERETQDLLHTTYQKLVVGLEKGFRRYLPILRRADGSVSFQCKQHDARALAGIFWSKGIGAPVWFSAWGPEGAVIAPPPDFVAEVEHEDLYSGVNVRVWRLQGPARSDFVEFLWETPWKK